MAIPQQLQSLGVNAPLSRLLGINVTNVSTEQEARNALSKHQSIVLYTSIGLTSNLTVNYGLTIVDGGSIATNGFTLTINGPFHADLFQCFDTSNGGSVVFGTGSVEYTVPQWWGTTDTAIQAAINAYRCTVIPHAIYQCSHEILISNDSQSILCNSVTLQAAANSINILHWTKSLGVLSGSLTIDGNGHSGITALRVTPLDESQTSTQVAQDYNSFSNLILQNCAEGIVLQCGPYAGGLTSACWHNIFRNVVIASCTRGIWLKNGPNTSSSGPNRNEFYSFTIGNTGANTGVQIDAGQQNKWFAVSFEEIASGSSPTATPTGIVCAASGTYSGSNSGNTIFGVVYDSCTRNSYDPGSVLVFTP